MKTKGGLMKRWVLNKLNMNPRKKRRLVKISFFFILLICYSIYVIINWDDKIFFYGREEPVEIQEAFMCNGPDEEGKPTEEVTKFSKSDLGEIYFCVEVAITKQATLDAYWIYNDDGRAFASGPLIRIFKNDNVSPLRVSKTWKTFPEGELCTIVQFINQQSVNDL